jgi:hypothetical protein
MGSQRIMATPRYPSTSLRTLGYKTAPAEAGFGRYEACGKSLIHRALCFPLHKAKFVTTETRT